MRVGISAKLNGLILFLLGLGIVGAIFIATDLFRNDLGDNIRKEALDVASLFAGRMNSELKVLVGCAETLGALSFADLHYPEDRARLIQETVNSIGHVIAAHLINIKDGEIRWSVLNSNQNRVKIAQDGLKELNKKFPFNRFSLGQKSIDLVLARTPDSTPVVRLGFPVITGDKGDVTYFIAFDLEQDLFSGVLGEASQLSSILLNRQGEVIGSSDLRAFEPGRNMQDLEIVKAAVDKNDAHVQMDFQGLDGSRQIGAFVSTGFAGLSVVSFLPFDRATLALKKLYRRAGFLVAVFLFLALGLGLVLSRSLVAPIQILAQAAEKVRVGELKFRVNTKTGDELQLLANTFNQMIEGLEERQKMGSLIEKFHHPEIVNKLMKGAITLSGERYDAIVFMSDLRGYTRFSEQFPPELVVKALNKYLGKMVEIIFRHGGVVDKFIGDAVLAVWGVPDPTRYSAKQALLACLEMRRALIELNKEFSDGGLPEFQMGMTLNAGPVVAGTIGSQEKMEYTIIGDTVNTCSRMEGLTKRYDTDLLVSESVAQMVNDEFNLIPIPNVQIRGKVEQVTLYKVTGIKTDLKLAV